MRRLIQGMMVASGLSGCFTGCPFPLCVARGTWVRTPHGKRRVEDLVVDDEVVAVDPDSGALVPTRLVAVRSAKRECVQLTVAGRALTLTSDHPVYCPTSKGWHPAGDWALGKRTALLHVSDEGTTQVLPVTQVQLVAAVHDVFDLTVAHDLHNFVADGVLVHNKSPARMPCEAPDASTRVYRYDTCRCPDGSAGYIECLQTGGGTSIECASCGPVVDTEPMDGGRADGGPTDAGGSDGGP